MFPLTLPVQSPSTCLIGNRATTCSFLSGYCPTSRAFFWSLCRTPVPSAGEYRTSRTEHTTDPWASLATAVINLSFQQLRLLDPLSHKDHKAIRSTPDESAQLWICLLMGVPNNLNRHLDMGPPACPVLQGHSRPCLPRDLLKPTR